MTRKSYKDLNKFSIVDTEAAEADHSDHDAVTKFRNQQKDNFKGVHSLPNI